MAKYLDPKADLTFKKVFGSHPDLLISLLNALLPLDDAERIESIEYLPVELVPDTAFHKDTIVDVRCKDVRGRQFVVEMQMAWTTAFMQRVLFNASKAYVSQAEVGYHYSDLQPVYSLNLVNDTFAHDIPDFRHDYKIVHDKYSNKVIEGLHFTFIELTKFTPQNITEKRMAVLWLRYLTEINAKTNEVPDELLDNPEISRAVEVLRVSAFSKEELYSYERFWDKVSRERTLMRGKYTDGLEQGRAEGWAEGMEKGKAEGLAEGMEKGKADEKVEIARNMLRLGISVNNIAAATGLTETEINQLL